MINFHDNCLHLCFSPICHYKIVTNSENVIKFEDEDDIELECKIKSDDEKCPTKWKNCTWVRSKGHVRCFLYHVGDKVESSCDNAMKNIKLVQNDVLNVNDGVCRIKLPPLTFDDKGDWKCSIEPCMNKEQCQRGIGIQYSASIDVDVCI